jgi:cholesterol oxidase
MSGELDAVVIGSGFGGAIVACRLAEKGMKVLVLERGRRWMPNEYPRRPGDAWLFNDRQPARRNGWLDLRFFRNMTVAQAAGVGGGSLAYSSVALEAHPSLFSHGWPAEITHGELKPHYETVTRTMNLQTVPDGQLTQRFKLMQEAAASTGHADRFAKTPLAVSFSPDWHYGLDEPFEARHSRPFTNAQGQAQGTCIHLGNCDIGCDVRAKNTLDLNYIPQAERHGADVRPLHIVRRIEPRNGGYAVSFDRIRQGRLVSGEARARRVFLAAGSLGSTELLLRCRDQYRTLPHVSRRLGSGWSANANVLSMATYADGSRVQQTLGPTISGAIDFTDEDHHGQRFIIEDDGFPNVLRNALRACLDEGTRTEVGRSVLTRIEEHVRGDERSRNLMVWLGAGIDAADGRLTLRRPFFAPWRRTLDLEWSAERSAGVVEAILAVHRTLTDATGGDIRPPLAWNLFRNLMTLHPLGGCAIGSTPADGVVNHLGQVFGHPNLHVVDGAILPMSTGRNPSHTIAALAERIAAHAV